MHTIRVAAYLRTSLPAALPLGLMVDLSETMAPVIVAAVSDADSSPTQARRRVTLAARRILTATLAAYAKRYGDTPIELIGALYDAAETCGEAAAILYGFADRNVCRLAA